MTDDTLSQTTYYRQLENDAKMIAGKAMKILDEMQGVETLAVQKDEIDVSTSADLAAETCIVDFIKDNYPTHGIYSEELGEIKGSDPYRWVIDPLDQTKEYVRGLSEYNCLIGIEHEGHVVAGVTLVHGLDEEMSGSKGNGVRLNDKVIHVSNQEDFTNSFVGFNLPNRKIPSDMIAFDMNILSTLIPLIYRVRPFWDQSKAMGYVARGVLDGNIVPAQECKWFDVASSIILVTEAGGMVTDWSGNPVTESSIHSGGIVASNGKIHEKLLKIIASS